MHVQRKLNVEKLLKKIRQGKISRREFVATAEICSDCNVALVDPSEIRDEPEPEELPPVSELVPIRIASVDWVRGFSEALQEANVPHRVGPPPQLGDDSDLGRRSHDSGVAIYVRAEDHEQAMQLDGEFLRSQIPDIPAEGSAAASSDGESCPACGDPIAADDPECAGCGLPFLELE